MAAAGPGRRPWAVPPPPRPDAGDGGLSLRELIEHVVRFEVAAFEERRESRRLDRVFSAAEIERGPFRCGRPDAIKHADFVVGEEVCPRRARVLPHDAQAAVFAIPSRYRDGIGYVDGEVFDFHGACQQVL